MALMTGGKVPLGSGDIEILEESLMNAYDEEGSSDIDETTAKVIRVIKNDIETGKRANESEQANRVKHYNIYRAKGDDIAERDGRSRIKCSDTMDAIEWMMPSFMRTFAGSNASISVVPVGTEDVKKAEKHERLINWQFMGRRVQGFNVLYEWIKTALIYGTSVIKVTWRDIYVKKGFDMPVVSEAEMQNMLADSDFINIDGSPEDIPIGSVLTEDILASAQNDPIMLAKIGQINAYPQGVQPVALESMRVYRDVRGTKKIKSYSGPQVEVISPEDFYMDPEARSIEEAQFAIHRVWRTFGELRQLEQDGIYQNVDKVKEWVDKERSDQSNHEESARYAAAGQNPPETNATYNHEDQLARRKLEVFEWWGLIDLEGEGFQEPYLIVFCGESILRMEKNPYGHGQPPFEVLRPMLDPFKFTGIGMPELVGEFQSLKTALIRQTLDNISFQNNGMWLVNRNAGVDINALLNPRPGTVVRTNIVAGSVQPLTPPSLHSMPLTMIELADSMLQKRTGVTSYNQGIDADSLNKMLALDTPIPMADGTVKLNKDVVAGDMVIGSDGKPTQVLKAHPVQMPERAFEITFGNGDVIKAGGEHLWTVSIREGKKVFSGFETLPTERIFDILADGKHTAVIPRVKAIEYPEKELTLDPYILGAWLGDGNSHTNRFTSMDEEIADRFRKWAEQFYGGGIEPCKQQRSGRATTYQIVNTPFRRMLKDLHCLVDSRYEDTKNNIKHIPEEYFTASKEQRLELLKGLMDTDGCRYKYRGRVAGSSAVFCTSNERLMEDVCRLITSLGGIPKITSREPVNQDGRKYKRHYHISFSMAECPFSIERKGRDWRAHVNTGRVKILSIKEIEVEPMRCLSVKAEDRMYCCGKYYTVTRNTATGVTAIMGASSQRIELIARVMAETGFRKLYKKMLMLNQQFIDQEIVIRVHGQPLEISPDDLAGNFDVSVDIGGATNKEQQEINQMMTVLNYSQILLQLGVMVPRNVYEIVKKIFETWGVADSEKYITDPQDTEQLRQIIQYIDQLGMMVQNGQPPSIEQLTSGIMAARQILINVVGKDLSQEQPQPGVAPVGERESADRSEGDGIAYSSGVIPGGPGGAK